MGNKKTGHEFLCRTCATNGMDLQAFLTHMEEKHGIKAADLKGSRHLRTHVDGEDWYSYTYDWDFGGIAVTESIVARRTKDSQLFG